MLQTTRLSKNLASSIDVAERDEIDTVNCDDNCEDKTVKRSLSKNLNGTTGYLTPEARLAFIELRKVFTKLQFSNIWIQNVISGLKLTRQATLLVES